MCIRDSYITAVVGINGTYVDIYQSYGNNVLYDKRLNTDEFKQHLKNMKNIATYPREQAIAMVKGFERRVYDNDFDAKFEDMANEYNEDNKDELIDELFNRFIIDRTNTFSVKVYKFEHSDCPAGGKRKKRKTHKKSNLKKSKRKLRKTKRIRN